MSKMSQLRRKFNYETDVPRCETCTHVRKMDGLRNSVPQPRRWLCDRHGFECRENAVCDRWQGRDGSMLEKANP